MVQGWLLRGSEREPPAAGVLREHPGTERVPKTGHCESVPALKECRNQGHCESAPALRECPGTERVPKGRGLDTERV